MSKDERKSFTTTTTDAYDSFVDWAMNNECLGGYGRNKFIASLSTRFTKRKTNSDKVYERLKLVD